MSHQATPEATAPEDAPELEDGAKPQESDSQTQPEAGPDNSKPNRLAELTAFLNEKGSHDIPDPDGDDEPQAAEGEAPTDTESEGEEQEEQEATESEAEADDQPGDEPIEIEAETAEDPDRAAPNRVRLTGIPEAKRATVAAALELLKVHPDLDPEEAFRIVAGAKPTKAETTPADAPKPITDLQQELESLDNELATAMEELNGKKVVEIQRKQRALQEQILDRKAEDARKATVERVSHEQQVTENYDKALALLPDSVKADGSLTEAAQAELDKELNRMLRFNPGLQRDPEWPQQVVASYALKKGLPLKTVAATPAAKPGVKAVPINKGATPPPTQKAKPQPGPSRGTPPTNPEAATGTALAKEIQQAKASRDPRKLAAVLAKHGQRTIADD